MTSERNMTMREERRSTRGVLVQLALHRKARFIVGCFVLVVMSSVTLAWFGKSGDRNATGSISDAKASESFVTVKGRTESGSLWLGCTVTYKDDYEHDVTGVKKVKGSFTTSLSYKLRPQGVDSVTVALWRWKISKSRCAKNNGGEACEHCKKNGFHFEERQDSETVSP